jgi:hypothetical protein
MTGLSRRIGLRLPDSSQHKMCDVRTPARLNETLQRWRHTLPDLLAGVLRDAVEEAKAARAAGRPMRIDHDTNARDFPVRVTTEQVPGEKTAKLRLETFAGRGLWLFALRRLLTSTLRELLRHRWTILRSPAQISWVTSDDPVVRLHFRGPANYHFRGGWGSAGTEIFVPLGPNHLLYTRVGSPPPRRGTVLSAEQAEQFQFFTI